MLPSPARSLPSRSLMADCCAREMDDLHRWWLPPEIFADIGIADAAPPSPVDIEGIAVHLAGLLGGGWGGGKEEAPRSPPPPGGASYHHGTQVCGLEGKVLEACGGGGGAASARPVLRHSPVQWQVPTNLVNGDGGGGGVLDPRLAPLRPCHGSSPAKRLGGGTGVFLPRAVVYQRAAATKSPARDGIPPKERLMKQQQQQRDEAASGMKQQRQNEMVQKQQNAAAAAALHACPELALPQEWTY